MDDTEIHALICMQTAHPKHRPIRSRGALYAILLVVFLAGIVAGNVLDARFGIAREYVQIPLYIALIAFTAYAYRRILTSFRYTLTDRVFAIERITAGREFPQASALLSDIESIAPYSPETAHGRRVRNYSPYSKRQTIMLEVNTESGRSLWLTGIDDECLEKLTAQWKNAVN